MDSQQEPSASVDSKAVLVWAEYARDRYEAAEKRLSDFRGWARQLGAAIAVVIGLEAALLSQISKAEDSIAGLGVVAPLVLLGIAIAHQLILFGRGIGKGYVGQGILGPESALVLAEHLPGKSQDELQRILGAYFAKGAEGVHGVAEGVANEVGVLARNFQRSLWLLFAVLVLVAGTRVHSALERKSMTDTPSSSGPAQPAAPAAPAAAPPGPATSATPSTPSPLLTTPTTGRTETKAAEPSREKMVATPTPGQRITEGTNKPRLALAHHGPGGFSNDAAVVSSPPAEARGTACKGSSRRKLVHVRIITGSKASFFMSLTPWTNGTLISHPDTINLPRAMECFELQGAVWPGEYLFRILCPGPSLGRFDSRPFKIRDITYLRNPIDLGSIAMTPVR